MECDCISSPWRKSKSLQGSGGSIILVVWGKGVMLPRAFAVQSSKLEHQQLITTQPRQQKIPETSFQNPDPQREQRNINPASLLPAKLAENMQK